MKVKYGDLMFPGGIAVHKLMEACEKYVGCNGCPYQDNLCKTFCDLNWRDIVFEIPSRIKFAIYDDIINDLREYAEKKFQNGEIEMAHGILKAACKIRQDYESEMQDAEHTQ